MVDTLERRIGQRLIHSLSHETAKAAGLNLEQLKLIAIAGRGLSEWQVRSLARHFRIPHHQEDTNHD